MNNESILFVFTNRNNDLEWDDVKGSFVNKPKYTAQQGMMPLQYAGGDMSEDDECDNLSESTEGLELHFNEI